MELCFMAFCINYNQRLLSDLFLCARTRAKAFAYINSVYKISIKYAPKHCQMTTAGGGGDRLPGCRLLPSGGGVGVAAGGCSGNGKALLWRRQLCPAHREGRCLDRLTPSVMLGTSANDGEWQKTILELCGRLEYLTRKQI